LRRREWAAQQGATEAPPRAKRPGSRPGTRLRDSGGTPTARAHSGNRTREAQGPLGPGESGTGATGQRAMRPPGMQPRTRSTSKPTPPRPLLSARVGYIANNAHGLAGNGHGPRQRPAPDLRRSPPGPWRPRAEHTCRRSHLHLASEAWRWRSVRAYSVLGLLRLHSSGPFSFMATRSP
jgi:hypothetical protein